MFKNILVPLDGSPMANRILPHVAAIPQKSGATITFLRVLETDGVELRAVDPMAWHFAKLEAQAHLDEAARQLTQSGFSCNPVLLEGSSVLRIVEYAHMHHTDLIVLSSHGQGGLSSLNLSSVALQIIQCAGTSIMLIHSSEESAEVDEGIDPEIVQYHRILAPLDGSQRAESTLPLASALAERHAAELILVCVVIRPEMIQPAGLSLQDSELADHVVERNMKEADKYFAQLQSRLPHPPNIPKMQTRVLVDESVTRALHDFVEQEQVDLIVLTAHGNSCDTRWPYSALVNSFITYGSTSLLILQDLPANKIKRFVVGYGAEDLTMPSRSEHGDEGLNNRAQFGN